MGHLAGGRNLQYLHSLYECGIILSCDPGTFVNSAQAKPAVTNDTPR